MRQLPIYTIFLSLACVAVHADDLLVVEAQAKLIAEVRVPALETGVLDHLGVREGDVVTVDQDLGHLNTDLLEQQLRLAKLDQQLADQRKENDVDLRFNRKSFEVTEAELRRATDAIERVSNSVSASEYDQLRLQSQKAELSVEQAINEKRVADITAEIAKEKTAVAFKRVQRCHLRSPIDGVVVELLARPGEWLNPGDSVMRIVRMDRLYVETFVDGAKYGQNLRGKKATFHTVLPGGTEQTFQGTVFFVSPEVHPVTGKISVVAEIQNQNLALRPGARGTLRVLQN